MKATTELDEITVFGARGTTLMILRLMQEYWQGRVRVVALIDDIDNGFTHEQLGVPVVSSEVRLRDYRDLPVLNTVSRPEVRARIHARLVADGATLATAICPDQPHVDPAVTYGAGCVVGPSTRIGPDVVVGEGALVLSSLVAHDTEIGACSNLGIHSVVLGHAVLGERVNLAPNAIVGNGRPDRPLRVGAGTTLGVGAVATRDVPAGASMVGNPAIPIEQWRKLYRLLNRR